MAKNKVINGLLPETPDEVVPEQSVPEQEISEEVITTEVPVQAGYGSRDFGKTRS
jgi:hypothetical protein